MRRAVLVFLAACSSDAKEPPAAKAPDATVVKPPARVVELARVSSVTLPPIAKIAVIVARDGSLAVAPIAKIDDAGVALASLQPEPVAKLDELAGKVTALNASGRQIAIEDSKLGRPCVDGLSRGDGTDGWGTIGSGRYGDGIRREPAGLRAKAGLGAELCDHDMPLVLVDRDAPAARAEEVLSALPASVLGATIDGDHAVALAATFAYTEGNTKVDSPTSAFTLRPDKVVGVAAFGDRDDASIWTWDGDLGGVGDAYRAAIEVDSFRLRTPRIRFDGDVTAGELTAASAALVLAGARELIVGVPMTLETVDTRPIGKPAPRPIPKVELGTPSGTGGFDLVAVRRNIRRNLPKITYCYEKRLLAIPGLEGTVDSSFVIQADGTVRDAKATGVHDEVASCIQGVIEKIEFPKPKGGEATVTSYPIQFSPSGG